MSSQTFCIAEFMAIFVAGIIIGLVVSNVNFDSNIPTSYSIAEGAKETVNSLNPLGNAPERNSPADRIAEWQIEVFKDKVILDIQDAEWASFADTNSMDPVLDQGANAIQIKPKSADEIKVGDIVSYEHADQGRIIHRVAYKGTDENGTYFIMKGDNNPTSDPDKVRFSQIKSVTVAIIY